MKKIISALLSVLMLLSLTSVAFAAENVIAMDGSWLISTTSDLGSTVEKAFDNDVNTYWHTNYTSDDGVNVSSHDECPHTITVDFGKIIKVSGWEYTPRIDNGTGTILGHNIYASEDGEVFKLIYSGMFEYPAGAEVRSPAKESWGNVNMRAIKIEVTSSLAGYGTAAEIKFFSGGTGTAIKNGAVYSEAKPGNTGGTKTDASKNNSAAVNDKAGRHSSDGTPFLDKTGWKADVNSISGAVNQIFDGNVDTYWHSAFVAVGSEIQSHDNPPYHLVVTLPEAVLTSGIVLTPRTDNQTGRIMGADIYVSDSDNGEWFLFKEGMIYDANANPKEMAFTANLKIKRVWVEITAGMAGYGTLAEFDLMAPKDDYETISYKDYAKHEEENMLYEIDLSQATADYAGESWGDHVPQNIFDGANATFWQTEAIVSEGWPAVLTVDLKNTYNLSEIRYLPRQSDDCHGTWLDVTVSGSSDGQEWFFLNEGITFEQNTMKKIIPVKNAKNVRYVEFRINKANASRVSCAEISFFQTKTDKDAFDEAKNEKYVMQIGSKTIKSTKGKTENIKELDVAPYIVNGSTMIPLRGLLEEMGALITWNGENETIIIDNGQNIITLQIWNYLVYVEGTRYGTLRYTLLNPPIISESRSFIPIRFISEQLGYKVTWDGQTQTITIEK